MRQVPTIADSTEKQVQLDYLEFALTSLGQAFLGAVWIFFLGAFIMFLY